jgi:hypothetical protein
VNVVTTEGYWKLDCITMFGFPTNIGSWEIGSMQGAEPLPSIRSPVFTSPGALVRLLLLTNLATNVGPEFLGHIADRIQEDVGAPDAERVA